MRHLRRVRLALATLAIGGGTSCLPVGDGSDDRIATVAALEVTAVSQVAGGGFHTCVRLTNGTVMCGGVNDTGQVGDGTTTPRPTPVAVPGLSGVLEISGGRFHSCARLSDNTVQCWGGNQFGAIGDGTSGGIRPTPTVVTGLANVASLSNNASWHTCAVLFDGTVKCWGNNENGQLGDGTMTNRPTPTTVPGLGSVVAVSNGHSHSCALIAGGTVKCWGANGSGQLGDGTTTNRLTPTTVPGLTGAGAISAGINISCAIVAGGAVNCWGAGGSVGDGTTTTRLTPTAVPGITGVVRLASSLHTCAVLLNSSIACWGFGYMGDGLDISSHLSPTVPHCLGAVSQAAVTPGLFSCVTHTDGAVSCWGANGQNQFADGSGMNRLVPVVLPTFPGAGTGTSASCCSAHGGTGCNRPAVVSCVCDDDPFCCTTQWDPVCASSGAASPCWSALCGDGVVQAGELCDDGNLFNGDGCDRNCRREGFACVPHSTPDISDATTSGCVCGGPGGDTYCCDVAWDNQCVTEAHSWCNACGDPCVVHNTPGSWSLFTTNCVCQADNFCCTNHWDQLCVNEAVSLCGNTCP